MKLTAPDAAFLHLCSIWAADPWKIRDPAFRASFQAVLRTGLPCEGARMGELKWAFMEAWKTGGYEPDGDPAAAQSANFGGAFLDAFAPFSEQTALANEARATMIMTRYFQEAS